MSTQCLNILPWCRHGNNCPNNMFPRNHQEAANQMYLSCSCHGVTMVITAHVITMETTTIFTKWLPWRYSTCCLYQNRVWKHSRHEMYRVPDSFGKQQGRNRRNWQFDMKKTIRLKRGKEEMYNNLEMGKKRKKLTIWHGKKWLDKKGGKE